MPRLYDRYFAIAILSQTCFVLANTLTAHYARWVEFLGGDVIQVGWVVGSGPIISLIARPVLGHWINVLGARASWGLGYLLFAAGAVGNIWLVDLGFGIYLFRCLMALGSAFVFAGSLTYVTQVSPVERRTEAIGILGAGGFIGMLVGPWLGDTILGASDRQSADFQYLFAASTVASLLPALLLFFLKKTDSEPRKSPSVWSFAPTVKRYWPGSIMAVCIAFGVCMTVPFAFLASYVDAKGLFIDGGSAVGLFFLGYGGWGLCLRVLSRRLPDRIGRRKVLFVGLVAMSLSMLCYPLVTSERPWLIILPGIVGGTGHALVFHTMMALALERFPAHVRGTGSALALMMLDLGFIAGAPLLGTLVKYSSYDAMFPCISLLTFGTTAFYYVCTIRQQRVKSVEMDVKEVNLEEEPDDVQPQRPVSPLGPLSHLESEGRLAPVNTKN